MQMAASQKPVKHKIFPRPPGRISDELCWVLQILQRIWQWYRARAPYLCRGNRLLVADTVKDVEILQPPLLGRTHGIMAVRGDINRKQTSAESIPFGQCLCKTTLLSCLHRVERCCGKWSDLGWPITTYIPKYYDTWLPLRCPNYGF